MGATFTPADVAAFEHATWSRSAPGYEEGFAVLTREAAGPLLKAANVQSGTRLLDVGTGSGVVAAIAREKGADVVGIDFSEPMLVEARRGVPDVEFRTASADNIPFGEASFDAVVANGVLHHLGEPDRALDEAHRVLTDGGRIACTVWAAPETLEAFGLFFAAVEEHAGSAELPHGPLFGVTDDETLSSLFTTAGFSGVEIETIETTWKMPTIDPLLRAFSTWAQLDSFPADTRTAIETSVRGAARAYETEAGLAVPNPMLLIAASK